MKKQDFEKEIRNYVSGDYTRIDEIEVILDNIIRIIRDNFGKDVEREELREVLLEISYRNACEDGEKKNWSDWKGGDRATNDILYVRT